MIDDTPRPPLALDHQPPLLPWEQPVSPDPAELAALASISRRLDRARSWLEAAGAAPGPARVAENQAER